MPILISELSALSEDEKVKLVEEIIGNVFNNCKYQWAEKKKKPAEIFGKLFFQIFRKCNRMHSRQSTNLWEIKTRNFPNIIASKY